MRVSQKVKFPPGMFGYLAENALSVHTVAGSCLNLKALTSTPVGTVYFINTNRLLQKTHNFSLLKFYCCSTVSS